MAINVRDMNDRNGKHAVSLAARAAARLRADVMLSAAIDDFFLPDDARLDDRMRAGIGLALTGLVTGIERAVRQHAARSTARDEPALSDRLARDDLAVLDRLVAAGLLRDADLMRELIARVRQDAIGDALPAAAPVTPDMPSLLTRLANHPDSVVADAAGALFAAEGRRRGLIEGAAQADIPAELHHRLVWWVAAALRTCLGDGAASLDHALAQAALRSLAAHDESERLEAAAMRLALAYEATADELPGLLVEALGDRRIALFTALLARAVGLDYDQVRDMVADPDAGHLWIMLRALDCARTAIAQVGLALSEADPRRDLEAFADMLDEIMTVTAQEARDALTPMKLHPAYRDALAALARPHGGAARA